MEKYNIPYNVNNSFVNLGKIQRVTLNIKTVKVVHRLIPLGFTNINEKESDILLRRLNSSINFIFNTINNQKEY